MPVESDARTRSQISKPGRHRATAERLPASTGALLLGAGADDLPTTTSPAASCQLDVVAPRLRFMPPDYSPAAGEGRAGRAGLPEGLGVPGPVLASLKKMARAGSASFRIWRGDSLRPDGLRWVKPCVRAPNPALPPGWRSARIVVDRSLPHLPRQQHLRMGSCHAGGHPSPADTLMSLRTRTGWAPSPCSQ